MSSGPKGQLCRDLVEGSLTIKGRRVLDEHVNLKARGGIINGTLTVNEDVTVCGNVIVRDVVQSGAKPPVLLTGNTYTVSTDDTTLIIPNMFCFGLISDLGYQGYLTRILRPTGDHVIYTDGNQVTVFQYQGGSVWTLKGAPIVLSTPLYVYGVDIANSGNTIVFLHGTYCAVYDWNGSSWVQRGSNITGVYSSFFNNQQLWMADDGNSFITSHHLSGNGSLFVYEWNGSAWVQKGTPLVGTSSGDRFGFAVFISGDGNSIASTAYNGEYARVYDWNGSNWVQRGAEISISSSHLNSVNLSLNKNTIALVDEGVATYVYDWNGSSWVQRGLPINQSGSLGPYNARQLTMSYDGNRLALGDITDFTTTSYIGYDWNGSSWVESFIGSSTGDVFEVSLSGDGTRLSIATNGPSDGPAEVRCFQDTTVSLELPDARACPGQELNINSENNFVYSTENNILHLYDFNTTTNEVMGNLDTFAILQSDGENWIRVFNKLPNF